MIATLQRSAGAVVHRAQPGIRAAWQRAVVRRGRDSSAAFDRRRSLVLAPHPDDETLGCGATIARKVRHGTEVRVVIAADGRYAQKASSVVTPTELGELRSREVRDAVAALGLPQSQLRQLGHEDTHLDEAEEALTATLVEELRSFAPAEVLLPSGLDDHPDHQTLHRAAHEALRRVRFEGHVAEFPVWYWADGPWIDLSKRPRAARLAHFVAAPLIRSFATRAELVDARPVLDRKREALAAHVSQTSNLTGEDVWGVMDEEFLAQFLLPYEIFFAAASPAQRR